VFKPWLRAVGAHWKRESLGGARIGTLALISELSGLTVAPRIYEVAAAVLIFYAMFLAWAEGDGKRQWAEERLREIESQKLNCTLSASLGQVGDRCSVATDLIVYNRGRSATALKKWDFRWKHFDDKGEHQLISIPMNLAFGPQGVERIGPAIADDQGISAGGMRTIRKIYPVDTSLEEIRRRGFRITITFQDIEDNPYSAVTEFPPVLKSTLAT
jgi:hypothetical protein